MSDKYALKTPTIWGVDRRHPGSTMPKIRDRHPNISTEYVDLSTFNFLLLFCVAKPHLFPTETQVSETIDTPLFCSL